MNADMMERLGITIDQAHLVGWSNVMDFARSLWVDSATWRALHPEEAKFSSMQGIAYMLADLYDLVNVARRDGMKAATRPKPYKRPDDSQTKQIGKDPIPIKDFDEWYYGG